MEKKVKYYKIKNNPLHELYENAIKALVCSSDNGSAYFYHGSTYYFSEKGIENLKKAGVLDLWFDPVFQEEVIEHVRTYLWLGCEIKISITDFREVANTVFSELDHKLR